MTNGKKRPHKKIIPKQKKERKDLLGNDAMPGWTDQSSERREKEKRRDGEMGFGTSAA